jgi:hypothetical protein
MLACCRIQIAETQANVGGVNRALDPVQRPDSGLFRQLLVERERRPEQAALLGDNGG